MCIDTLFVSQFCFESIWSKSFVFSLEFKHFVLFGCHNFSRDERANNMLNGRPVFKSQMTNLQSKGISRKKCIARHTGIEGLTNLAISIAIRICEARHNFAVLQLQTRRLCINTIKKCYFALSAFSKNIS